jgi:hypothetical protein
MGAVHVHFAVANLVEPAPGKKCLPCWGIRGNGKGVVGSQGAATLHGFNDSERLSSVVRERQLARATAVSSTAFQRHAVLLAAFVGSN